MATERIVDLINGKTKEIIVEERRIIRRKFIDGYPKGNDISQWKWTVDENGNVRYYIEETIKIKESWEDVIERDNELSNE